MTTLTNSRTVNVFAGNTMDVPDEIEIVEEFPDSPPKGMIRWSILSKKGDTRLVWDNHHIAEINAAKDMFDDMTDPSGGGMKAYRVGADGKQSEVEMKSFDPHAEEVIFLPMPAVAGG